MPAKLPEEITSREGYKLICDEIEKAHNEVKESKDGTFKHLDAIKHYRELCSERRVYVTFQKEALLKKRMYSVKLS